MSKTEIIERLGETAVLLPGLIAEALAANDRIKVRLSLLQEAAAHAAHPERKTRGLEAERRAGGLDDPRLDALVSGARPIGGTRFSAPGVKILLEGVREDLEAMQAPLEAADAPGSAELRARLCDRLVSAPSADNDQLDSGEVAAMTSARRSGNDSMHLLVMDLHKAINVLAAQTAVDDLDGAKVHHLEDWDRARVAAFMRGVNRTRALAFGHPGLGTTAARSGERLTIQNDIGETDAHVLVIHVQGLSASVTYTDVHRRRARFFISLFAGRVQWTPLSERDAKGLGDEELFYLVDGRFEAQDASGLDAFLERLGSRIVFLIDWNKARKALQTFVGREAAVDLLGWAAGQDLGHRAFLELGGADLVLEAVRRTAAGRVPYGVRLDAALGAAGTAGFLRRVLRETSEGLAAGRSARLIRDEVQADLAQRFETAESAVLAIVVRHVGLSRTLAAAAAEALASGGLDDPRALEALVERSRRLEAKADRLTVQAREICVRLQDKGAVRRLVDSVEDAMDAIDESVFLLSLSGGASPARPEALSRLADIVVEGLGQMVRAAEAAARLPQGHRQDAVAALQAIDAATRVEREADAAERASISAFVRTDEIDAREMVMGLEVSRALETATDHVAHAALALRERVLEELSA